MTTRAFYNLMAIIAAAAFLAALPVRAAEPDSDSGVVSYTLSQSIKRALDVNPRIKAAEADIRKARSAVGARRSDFFPTLSAQSSVQAINSIRSRGPTDEDYVDQDIDLVNLRLSQTLFDGFKIFSQYQKSQLNRELVQARKQMVEKDLVLEIQNRFLELLKAREDIRSLRATVERLEVNLDSAESFFEKQMIPYADVLKARVELADASQQLSQAENQAETMRGELNILLGYAPARNIDYKGELTPQVDFDRPLSSCIEQAYENRPEMKIAQKSIQMAQKEKDTALGAFSPRLSADADYYYRNADYDEPGTSFGETYDRDQSNTYWSVSLRLQWNFGLGGKQLYQHGETAHELERLRQRRLDTRNQITAEVRTQFLNLREAQGRIGSTHQAVNSAREGYKSSKKRFEVRMTTISELLDAQALLSRAESNYNQAIADYLLSLARLNRAMGKTQYSLYSGK